ncbi:Fic family protein [Delftia tsuruhatensis]|uniref:Fic family protein n=1 Tax=Delftia tsuruhatensis TaxID=180282 RepID=UPI0028B24C9D|nr:Fic family protein [Delftia tsuruhatensis]
MIVYELVGSEQHSSYQELEIANVTRQYDFLKSMVRVSVQLGRPFLSSHVVKALNFHAITCLHTNAGEYRPCEVVVGDHNPPAHFRVQALMDDFINGVNRNWESSDPIVLSAFVLWRLNYIHPFINGNGRTARAACYFVLCLKVGGLLPGTTLLPELLQQHRPRYVEALRAADASLATGQLNLMPLHALIEELVQVQADSAQVGPPEHLVGEPIVIPDDSFPDPAQMGEEEQEDR